MHTFFIVLLVLTSVVALTFIVERALALRRAKIIPPAVQHSVEFYRNGNQVAQMRATCEANPSVLSRLLLFAMEHLDWQRNEVVELLETRARHETQQLERGLIFLEIVVGIAPLLGLVGTIYGLITLFGSMGGASGVDSAKFSQGISLALNATLLGLIVAIPALIGWSYFSKKVETLTVDLATICDEFLRKHYHAQPGDGATVTPARKSR
jgi:biopolymer transport protein ExbB